MKTHVTIKKIKNMVKCTKYIVSSAPIHHLLMFVYFCTGFITVYTTEVLFFLFYYTEHVKTQCELENLHF